MLEDGLEIFPEWPPSFQEFQIKIISLQQSNKNYLKHSRNNFNLKNCKELRRKVVKIILI